VTKPRVLFLVPGSVTRLHWSFEDPSRATGDEEQRLAVFRRVRDQFHERLATWLKAPSS
jgi:arsenate reductase (thioredoxin)